MTEWSPEFKRQETWIFNTHYTLFGDDGPKVHEAWSWCSRLDELAKCIGASTGQDMRLLYADAVINIEGHDMWHWMRHVGQTAPSEQQMVKMLLPNIQAAFRDEKRSWSLKEAQDAYARDGYGPGGKAAQPYAGQPTPGVLVWRNSWGGYRDLKASTDSDGPTATPPSDKVDKDQVDEKPAAASDSATSSDQKNAADAADAISNDASAAAAAAAAEGKESLSATVPDPTENADANGQEKTADDAPKAAAAKETDSKDKSKAVVADDAVAKAGSEDDQSKFPRVGTQEWHDDWNAKQAARELACNTGVKCNVNHMLGRISKFGSTGKDGKAKPVFGVLLEYSGANLRFLAKRPLVDASKAGDGAADLPDFCVTLLGGPKGMSAGVIDAVRQVFKDRDLPLLTVALGEQQQMAHVCMGYLRVEDQSGRYKAALTDLHRLGKDSYTQYMAAVDAALPGVFSSGVKRKRED